MNTKEKDVRTLNNSSSLRLVELLNEQGCAELGKGLATYVSEKANVSYTGARKWLFEDSLPRSADARFEVAKALNVDLLYWEHGKRDDEKDEEIHLVFKDNYLLHLKVANKMMDIIHEREVVISSKHKIALEVSAINIFNKAKIKEPDIDILNSLVDLLLL